MIHPTEAQEQQRLAALAGLQTDVDVVVHDGYTRRQLGDAFNMVRPERHWKDAIDATISVDRATLRAISSAIVFYTGSVASIHLVSGDPEGAARWRIRAAGYFATCGA